MKVSGDEKQQQKVSDRKQRETDRHQTGGYACFHKSTGSLQSTGAATFSGCQLAFVLQQTNHLSNRPPLWILVALRH